MGNGNIPSVRFAVAWVLVGGGVLGGCFVPPLDVTGRACDGQHPCPQGLVCGSGGVCGASGTTDAATGDGGLSDGGASDSGILWRQQTDGFDSTPTVSPGATATLDAGNVVEAFVPDAGNDRAEFTVSNPAKLPRAVEGKLRGWIRLPQTPSLPGKASFLVLSDSTNAGYVLALDVEFQGGAPYQLSCFTGAGFLQTAKNYDVAPISVDAGVAYAVEVQWQQGAFRRVFFNGSLLFNDPMGAGGTSAAIPAQLRLGIDHWDNGGTAPWSVEVGGWEMSDDAAAPWPGP